MSSVSRSSLRSAGGGIYETETMRLQREVDTFTQKLEHEKRRLLIIEEQIKQVNSELDDKKETAIVAITPSPLEERK
jgi:DNA gyrase/topoisomerase IV subunit A